MTTLTTLKNLMLGILVALMAGAPPAAAYQTYPGTPVEECQPVYVDGNKEPKVDPDCIGPSTDATPGSTECQPVYVDGNREPKVDPDCVGPTASAASATTVEAVCPPVYIDGNGNPKVDPDCIG